MCQSSWHDFLLGLPKCEHHVHLEGCLTPELIFQLAEKNQVQLPDPKSEPAYESIETLTSRYGHFSSLDDFLHFYFIGMSVLIQESDFADLAWAYFKKAHADGVHHAEVFFDPQVHQDRGIPYETIVAGFVAGCKRAEQELGLSTRLILCFVRHLPVESAKKTYQNILDNNHFDTEVIHGLGYSSSEVGPPKDMFREIYLSASAKGVRLTAHAGEEGDPTYITAALEMGATRIDHGIRLVEDPALMERVARENILLTVCPLSNVQLKCVKTVAEVPIRKFLDAGVKFSLNSDDPAYFGGYILDNYCAVHEAFNLSVNEWKTIAVNSVTESWIGEDRKQELLQRIDAHVEKFATLA
ncbi:adenosine deaminase [Aspergillus brunneoviolaceus CBS 621.78]|uniref:Adenine deaminase n=2 Tax=Aspergillus TaxID=5052 RepID=A0A8G1S3I2_9EURO|nr:adenosine deaminase [Aspergillus brunneoviolaceus CBS 621.78]XP_040805826.1 adenosine deaminase [Aspergillus fijiensis CBS 313.89]RAH41682.1 adenosine deaminase [Aspergillus brunneoviolaceus CBS 621.78]RAK81816.1 adenosine deaminase [Aspergillus fijiensis CBS 313.89]